MPSLRIAPFLLALLLALLLTGALPAVASARQCLYDVECDANLECRAGRCVARGGRDGRDGPDAQRSADDIAADEACGADRRCRIDRLTRRNRARRHARSLEEERYLERLIEHEEEQALEDFPRRARPIVADLRVSAIGPLGLMAGYTFFGRVRPEISIAYQDSASVFASLDDGSAIDGRHDAYLWWFGASYFFLDGWISPYLRAAFLYGDGEWNSYSFGFGRRGFGGGQLSTEYHALEAEGGLDLQFGFGLHARLGMALRPLIYNQARLEPGLYDDQTREGLSKWWQEDMFFDVVMLLGWAF